MEEATVEYAWSCGIRVKYLGPTNYRGSRWRVWRADETYANDPDAFTTPYNHALNGSENACAAVRGYLSQKLPRREGGSWAGRWVLAGANDSEYIAVRVPKS